MEERLEVRHSLEGELRVALEGAREAFPWLLLERADPAGSRGVILLGEAHMVGTREAEIAERLLDVLLSRVPHVALEGTGAKERARWGNLRDGSLRPGDRIFARLLLGVRVAGWGPSILVAMRAFRDARLEVVYLEEREEKRLVLLVWLLGDALFSVLRVVVAALLLAVPVVWVWTGAIPGRLLMVLGALAAVRVAWRLLIGFGSRNPSSRLVLTLPRWLRFLLQLEDADLLHERDRAMSQRLDSITQASDAPRLRLVIVGERHLEGMSRELGGLGWSRVP